MVSRENLVDISKIEIDLTLPLEERAEEFVQKVGNPRNFMCCGYEVTVSYASTELTFEQCVVGIFL